MKTRNVENNEENNIRSILLGDGHFLFRLKKKSTSPTWSYFDTNNINGITLIALIITIILMLILAGVVISLTIGENGIFKTAKYAVQKNSEETAREKLELALVDLQAHKYTVTDYDENDYIDNYLKDKKMQVTGDVVTVDGWNFTIDRSVPKIGEKTQQEDVKKITISTPYIGTTSFTTKVLNAYEEENIEEYKYVIDENEVTIQDKEYTTSNEQKLEPESTHKVKVIAKYKDGTTLESNTLTIKTEPRTYLYNNGDECVEITNGWMGQSLYGYGTSYGQYNKTDEYLYVKNTSTAAAGSSNYWPAWVTYQAINLSKYKKLLVEGEFYAPNCSVDLVILTNPSNMGTGSKYWNCIQNRNDVVNKIELDLTKDVDLSNLYHIAISCQNSNYNDHSEAKIEKVYLEK